MNKEYNYFEFYQVFNYERGRRLITQNQVSGDTAYISSTALNNGLDNYITPPGYMVVHENRLTLSNSGSVGYLFYHDYEFVASDHVTVIGLKNRDLNKYIAMFLKPIFEKIKYRYNFGREISNDRISKEKIYLPIDDYGKPDWAYMENYVKSLEHKVQFKKVKTKNKQSFNKLDISNWSDNFKVGEIFDCATTSHLIGTEINGKGETLYVTRSAFNNGVSDSIENDNYELNEGNCITIGAEGLFAFYQSEQFVAGIKVYTLKHNKLNKYNALFICSILNKNVYRYSYGRARVLDKIKEENILLPLDNVGEPDWQFMENHIKNTPYGDLI
jgi:hypothetical protein